MSMTLGEGRQINLVYMFGRIILFCLHFSDFEWNRPGSGIQMCDEYRRR